MRYPLNVLGLAVFLAASLVAASVVPVVGQREIAKRDVMRREMMKREMAKKEMAKKERMKRDVPVLTDNTISPFIRTAGECVAGKYRCSLDQVGDMWTCGQDTKWQYLNTCTGGQVCQITGENVVCDFPKSGGALVYAQVCNPQHEECQWVDGMAKCVKHVYAKNPMTGQPVNC